MSIYLQLLRQNTNVNNTINEILNILIRSLRCGEIIVKLLHFFLKRLMAHNHIRILRFWQRHWICEKGVNSKFGSMLRHLEQTDELSKRRVPAIQSTVKTVVPAFHVISGSWATVPKLSPHISN